MIVVTMLPDPPHHDDPLSVTAGGTPPISITVSVDGEELPDGVFSCETSPCGGTVYVPANAQGKILTIVVETGEPGNEEHVTIRRTVT